MTRRNLILIHRSHDYERDFREITEKVHALDQDITIFSLSAYLDATIPDAEWRYPTLTVALTPIYKLPIKRGPILQNHQIGKLVQQDIFRKHGIPTPPALPFRFGMMLDPVLFGELVVLKPMDLDLTSHGLVFLFRRGRLCSLKQQDLPHDHPVRLSPSSFLVQKYIHTGVKPYCIRVCTFLAKAIFCYTSGSRQQLPHLNAIGDLVEEDSSIWPSASERKRRLIVDEDAIQLAEAVHRALGSIPLLGVDMIRDHSTGKLYVLETNPGGNTWHFSSKIGEPTRVSLVASKGPRRDANSRGRLALIEQFGAFDVAARALVAKSRELSA